MKARCAMGVAAVLAGWGLLWIGGRAAPVRQPSAGVDSRPTPASLGFAGAGSCSGQGCHGRTDPVDDEKALSRRNEYTFCLTYDKHTRAYQVLTEKRAKIMAANLAATNPGGKPIEPHLDQRCLACHTTPEAAVPANPSTQLITFRAEGVSCEACHGPSKKEPKSWFAAHTASDTWRKLDSKQKAEYGFTALGDLKLQAETCAGCHVGAPADSKRGIPARDANHDIMAAGHPRLTFELTTFRANMPPHWNVALKEKGTKDHPLKPGVYEAQSWAVGQVASAKAALDLLMHRTKQATLDEQKANGTVRWPEFAEYRCFACHADLHPEWRDRKAPPGRIAGALPYDPWYNTVLPGLFKAVPGPQSDEISKLYGKLAGDMARPETDRATIDDDAQAILKALNGWLAEYTQKLHDPAQMKRYDPAQMLKAVIEGAGKPDTWEQAEQLTLAVAALKHAQIADYLKQLKKDPKAKPPDELLTLQQLAQALAFRDKDESPRGFSDPFSARSPVRKQLQVLLDALRQ